MRSLQVKVKLGSKNVLWGVPMFENGTMFIKFIAIITATHDPAIQGKLLKNIFFRLLKGTDLARVVSTNDP